MKLKKIATDNKALNNRVDAIRKRRFIRGQMLKAFEERRAQGDAGAWAMDSCTAPEQSGQQNIIDNMSPILGQAQRFSASVENIAFRYLGDHRFLSGSER